jgi:hypothetical protein
MRNLRYYIYLVLLIFDKSKLVFHKKLCLKIQRFNINKKNLRTSKSFIWYILYKDKTKIYIKKYQIYIFDSIIRLRQIKL